MADSSNQRNFTTYTSNNSNGTAAPTSPNGYVDDITLLAIAWTLFALGVLGNVRVLMWLGVNKRKTRIKKIICGLVMADLSVCIFIDLATALIIPPYIHLSTAIWCKFFKYMQGVSVLASNAMLIVMAVDRHQAIRSPLKKLIPAWRMIAVAWGYAFVASIPQLYVLEDSTEERETQPRQEAGVCSPNFDHFPSKAYVFYFSIVGFIIPFLLIFTAYARICKKLWTRAQANSVRASMPNATIFQLRNTRSRFLLRTWIKSLKMSAVIIVVFLSLSLPCTIVRVIMSFSVEIPSDLHYLVILVILLVSANSSLNPYILLFFNLRKS